MTDLLTALALALVIEGVVYALFPGGMQRMMGAVVQLPPSVLRVGGLLAVLTGVAAVWLIRTSTTSLP